ncbi:MAG TPA: alkaline phosphatase family protein [Pyrinomonadaceae bacterium]
MANRIEHLVVLMMENRSFDHMFGFLRSPDWPIDGLTGAETNPDVNGAPVRVSPDARYSGDLTPDPGHDFISVNEQVFGNSTAGGAPNMQGFVRAYHGKTKDVVRSRNVMKCFAPGRLPALATLAREYAVCDRWFSSVPGPTLPNRAFAWAGTSLGRVDMNPNYLALKTVFELLDGHGVSSKIYFTDVTIGLTVGYLLQRAKKFFAFFDRFRDDCKNDRLPAFSFLEPRFNDLSTPGQFFPAADQHPDHHVFQGEVVIKSVYDAVTSNRKVWEKTLLVITYDEHGGLYDHVPPPATVNPGDRPPGSTLFNFERLGVRVPAVLVSPFIPRGTIVRKVFDHASIVATASRLFLKSPPLFLTERDRKANTFEDCLTLPSARQGRVTIPQPTAPAPAAPPLARVQGHLGEGRREKCPGPGARAEARVRPGVGRRAAPRGADYGLAGGAHPTRLHLREAAPAPRADGHAPQLARDRAGRRRILRGHPHEARREAGRRRPRPGRRAQGRREVLEEGRREGGQEGRQEGHQEGFEEVRREVFEEGREEGRREEALKARGRCRPLGVH